MPIWERVAVLLHSVGPDKELHLLPLGRGELRLRSQVVERTQVERHGRDTLTISSIDRKSLT